MTDSEQLKPSNLQATHKKGKSFHRRTHSHNAYDFNSVMNLPPTTTPGLMEEIAKAQGVGDSNATRKALDAASNKQSDKCVIVEDINDIPKNVGWVVPKNPNADNNPLLLRKHNLTLKAQQLHSSPDKKPEKPVNQHLINASSGLNTIHERQQSVESSEAEPLGLRSGGNSTSSRANHARTTSWNESLFANNKQISRNSYNLASPTLQGHHRRVQFSLDLENKVNPFTTTNDTLLSRANATSQQRSPKSGRLNELFAHAGTHSAKHAKEKLSIRPNVTPETAKNFLKVLDKHKKAPSLESMKLESSLQTAERVSLTRETNDKRPNNAILKNLIVEDEKLTLIQNLESKLQAMEGQLSHLTQKTSSLEHQVIGLTSTMTLIQTENSALKRVTKFLGSCS